MDIKQISVFLENKKGRLAFVSGVLEKAKINIKALSLADTEDYGVLRLIVNKPEECLKALKENQITAQETQVIAVEVEDKPGGMHRILDILDKNDMSVEYMYATVEKRGKNAIVILKIEDTKKAIELLKKNKIDIVANDVLKKL